MNPWFSIVVPVYNRQQLAIRCLESIRLQNYRPIQLIVVDNDSTDNTFSEVSEWAKANWCDDFRVSVVQEKKRGACAARNRGLREISSDYVCFFDSDDAMRPSLVSEAVKAFENHPDSGIVTWRVECHPLQGADFIMKHATADGDILWQQLIHSVLRPQGYAARTDLFKRAGSWNEDLPVWNDWELGIRLLLQKPEVVVLPTVLADVFAQAESLTGTSRQQKIGQWELALDTAEKTLPAKWRDVVDYRRMVLAAEYAREGVTAHAMNLKRKVKNPLLRLVYHYTRLGGRGASLWWKALR